MRKLLWIFSISFMLTTFAYTQMQNKPLLLMINPPEVYGKKCKVHLTLFKPDFTPAVGASIKINNIQTGITDQNGNCILEYIPGSSNTVRACLEEKGVLYWAQQYFYSATNPILTEKNCLYVYTDRGVYNPGQEIKIRTLAWKFKSAYRPLHKAKIDIIFKNSSGKIFSGGSLSTNQFGVGAFKIRLPLNIKEGNYELIVKFNGVEETTRIKIMRFIPPLINIKHSLKRFLTDIQTSLPIEVTLSYFTGAIMRKSTLDFEIVNAQGKKIFAFQPKAKRAGYYYFSLQKKQLDQIRKSLSKDSSFQIKLTAKDNNNRSDTLTHDLFYSITKDATSKIQPYSAILEANKEIYQKGEKVKVKAKVVDLDGKLAKNIPLTLKFLETSLKINTTTNGKGIANFNFTMPALASTIHLFTPVMAKSLASSVLQLALNKPMISQVSLQNQKLEKEIIITFSPKYIPIEKVVHINLVDHLGMTINSKLIPIYKDQNRYIAKGKIKVFSWGTMMLNMYCLAIPKDFKNRPYSTGTVGVIVDTQKISFSKKQKLQITFDNLKNKSKPGAKIPIRINIKGAYKETCLGVSMTDQAVLSLLNPLQKNPVDHFYNPTLKSITKISSKAGLIVRNWGLYSHSNPNWKAPGDLSNANTYRSYIYANAIDFFKFKCSCHICLKNRGVTTNNTTTANALVNNTATTNTTNSATTNATNRREEESNSYGYESNQSEQDSDEDADEDFEEDGVIYVAKGKGSTKARAIAAAYRVAMLKHLSRNMNQDDYDSNKRAITAFLKRNGGRYAINHSTKKRYRRRRITIRARIEGEILVKEIKKEFTKARARLEGFEVAIVPKNFSKKGKDKQLDQEVLFDYVADKLGKHVVVRNLKNVRKLMQREASMTGQSATTNMASYLSKTYNQVQLIIKLSAITKKKIDSLGKIAWHANIDCQGKHPQTSRVIFSFLGETGFGLFAKVKPGIQMPGISERQARSVAIKNIAKRAVRLMIKKIRTRRTSIRQGVYDFKFVGFSTQQMQAIDDALADLSDGKKPYCKILPGGYSSGDQKQIKAKWLKGRSSQHRIISIIKEICAENEIILDAKTATQSNITFQPGTEEDEDEDDHYIAYRATKKHTKSFSKPNKKVSKKPAFKVITIRKNFPETAFWEPLLVTKNGSCAVTLKIPDSITEQNLTVVASDEKGEIALQQELIKVRQDLFVRSGIPAKITQGDKLHVYAQVHNFSGATQKLQVQLKARGIILHSPVTVEIEVANRSIAPVSWEIEAKNCGSYPYTIKVENKHFLDSETHNVFVAPYGNPHIAKLTGNTSANIPWKKQIKIDSGSNYHTAFLNITFPGVVSALQGLEALILFPHGCAEQTSSKLLINALVLKWAQNQKITSKKTKELPQNLRYGITRLAAMQHENGGWSWFGATTANRYLTNYCLYTLNKAKQVDILVDAKIIVAAINYILKGNKNGLWSAKDTYFWRKTNVKTNIGVAAAYFHTLVEAIYSLENRNQYQKQLALTANKLIAYLKQNHQEPLTIANAILGLYKWQQWTKDYKLTKLLQNCTRDLALSITKDHWQANGYKGYGGEIEVNARVLKLLCKEKAQYFDIIKANARWLLAQRNCQGRWYNTKGTAAAIEAFLSMDSEQETTNIKILVNGKVIKKVAIDSKDPFATALKMRNVEISQYLHKKQNLVEIVYDGKLTIPVVLEVKQWKAKNPSNRDLIITRQSPSSLSLGELANVTLQASSSKTVPFVMIEERIPSNMKVEQNSLEKLKKQGIISDYKIAPTTVYFYFDKLSKKQKLTYALYATHYGIGKHPGTTISAMYNPLQKALFIGKDITVVHAK